MIFGKLDMLETIANLESELIKEKTIAFIVVSRYCFRIVVHHDRAISEPTELTHASHSAIIELDTIEV